MSFEEYVLRRDGEKLTMMEMARKKKKSQPVVMPKKDDGKMVIKIDPTKVSIGHQQSSFRTGAHNPRPKRDRTRSQRKRNAIKDQLQ